MREKRLLRMRILRYLKILIALIIVLFLLGIMVLHISQRPFQKKRSITIDLVEKYAKFHDVSNFSESNVGTTYYSVSGKNKDNKPSFAIINKDMKHIKVFKQADGISQAQAEKIAQSNPQQKVSKIGLVLVKNNPAWLVSLKNENESYNYVTINFKNGKKIKSLHV